ncbi:hypothetical protein EJ08DRAFT_377489 [Tothia fuscella]|uniref:Opioid growth factor receptor (OGFr) conserved domain-containing protein n=1 Tax=Tothia fuscella TaxID=1048955 RepID=A0A9P4NLW2_9PEZI|nr:hypothetical protein EJ08DRAFT_377489 [Tothia fuscella]
MLGEEVRKTVGKRVYSSPRDLVTSKRNVFPAPSSWYLPLLRILIKASFRHDSLLHLTTKMASKTGTADAPEELLVNFYDSRIRGKDPKGRRLDDILAYTDRLLETGHDYIQIIFPLPEGSPYNWAAPIVNAAVFNEFRSRPELRANLRKSFQKLLAFYGFNENIENGHAKIHRADNHSRQFKNWVVRTDHNHLRISRIIRCLRVLGLEEDAKAFHQAIIDVDRDFPNKIGPQSLMYWKRAAERPLYLPPNEDDDDAITGPAFLREFVRAEADRAAQKNVKKAESKDEAGLEVKSAGVRVKEESAALDVKPEL